MGFISSLTAITLGSFLLTVIIFQTTNSKGCRPIPPPIITQTTTTKTTPTITTTETPPATPSEPVECSQLTTCQSCTGTDNCGWCDTSGTCLKGNSTDAKSSKCTRWFYRDCITSDKSTTCSDQIEKLNCPPQNICAKPEKSAEQQYDCQRCRRFNSCFRDDSDMCITWDEKKCPGGYSILKPVVLSVDSHDVRGVHLPHTLYICHMVASSGPVTVIAFEKPRVNYTGRIFASRQAGGILHKVKGETKRGNWSFAVAEKAELPEVFAQAEFTHRLTEADMVELEQELFENETPVNTVITRLRETLNTSYSRYRGYDLTGVQHVYRLIGKATVVTSDGTKKNQIILAVPKRIAERLTVKVNDIIFSNDTAGYMEVVDEMQQLSSDEILLKSHLAQAEVDAQQIAKAAEHMDRLVLTENKLFACEGGLDLMPGFSVFTSRGVDKDYMTPGNIIVGRESTAAAVLIASVRKDGGFVFYEGYPVISVGESGDIVTSFGPVELGRSRNKDDRSIGIGLSEQFSCIGQINKYCKACRNVKCDIAFDIRATVDIAAELGVKQFFPPKITASVGAQLVFDVAAKSEISITLPSSFSSSETLVGPIRKTFFLPFLPEFLPATVEFEIKQQLEVTVVGDMTIGASASGHLVKTYTAKFGDVKLPPPAEERRSSSITPILQSRRFKRVSITAETSAHITVTWPSIGAGSALKWLEMWKLPKWMNKDSHSVGKASLDIYVDVRGGFKGMLTVDSCKCCQTNKDKPHSVQLQIGPSMFTEAGAHVVFANPKVSPWHKFWPIVNKDSCIGPDFGLCGDFDAKCKQGKSIAFVIDTTGSMKDDIEGAIRGTANFFQSATSKDSDINDFVLVPFNDPGYGPVTKANTPDRFVIALRGLLSVGGGGDCPKMAMHGLELAIESIRRHSSIFVFTDASAKDYSLQSRIIDLIQQKTCQVVYVLTGTCSSFADDINNATANNQTLLQHMVLKRNSTESAEHLKENNTICGPTDSSAPDDDGDGDPGEQVYHKTALASNGHVFNVEGTSDDVSKVINYVESRFHARPLESLNILNATNRTVSFRIDSHLEAFYISISGTRSEVTVYNPDGVQVDYKKAIDLSNVLMITVSNVAMGKWSAATWVTSGSSYTIDVTGRGSMDFEFGFGQNQHDDFPDHVPLCETTYIFARLTNHIRPAIAEQVHVVSSNGSIFSCAMLSYRSGYQYQYVAGPVTLPMDTFRVKILGKDEKGFEFQRMTRTAVVATYTDSDDPLCTVVPASATASQIRSDFLALFCVIIVFYYCSS